MRVRLSVFSVASLVITACSGGGSSSAPGTAPVTLPSTAAATPAASPAAAAPASAPAATPVVTSAPGTSGPSAAPGTANPSAPQATPSVAFVATASPAPVHSAAPTAPPATAAPTAVATPPLANGAFVLPSGYTMSVIAAVPAARQLAALPNGDLLVGSGSSDLYLVPAADGAGVAGAPVRFATLSDASSASSAQGVAYANGYIYATTEHTLYRTPYHTGDRTASGFAAIAAYRTGGVAPGSDGDIHHSASVAVDGAHAYIGIGSSCNACNETDPTRATIQMTNLDGSGMTTRATRIRNAIGLTINPATGTLWAGGAGQDALPAQHPYEYMDAVGAHAGVADYGWPACEENQHAYIGGANCGATVAPLAELPAYSTIIGAAFYPATQTGPYAFGAAYRGGLFVTAHGSWHIVNGHHIHPRVAFFPMSGDAPQRAVNWSDPTTQWNEFVGGFQNDGAGDARIGRPTGIAVGLGGSLFVADDQAGVIYRIRPVMQSGSSRARR